ncbi:ABC transporter permease [Bacillus massiliigorillae]|uniref:ABC transporter permease n=1 Tax=Bacillus massiliigorillae TaxID=1243664 RepID=UPI000693F7EA|nr:FtsX-like permease family protein [Bacillus massiliigorillae]
MKRIFWKDIYHSITSSWSRFFAISCLMLLGVFAFVGLKVTGPDMRLTAENFFSKNHLADLSIVSTYGLNESDQQLIESANQLDIVEYGYLKDVVIKDTDESIRIFSAPGSLSQYEIINGSMPKSDDEIALDFLYEGKYKIGDTITFTEEEDVEGNHVLKKHRFTIVGFVKSSELVDKNNIGQTTVGTGKLNGYAVVTESTFDSEVYMIARLSFSNTKGLNAYSDKYSELVQEHKAELKATLQDQSEQRLDMIKEEKQAELDEGWDEIKDAKQQIADSQTELDDAKQQLDDVKGEIAENQEKLDTEVANALDKIGEGQKQLNDAQTSIATAEGQLKEAQKQLANGKATLDKKWAQLQSAINQLDYAKEVLNKTYSQLASVAQAIQEGKAQLDSARQQITQNEQSLVAAQNEINENQKDVDANKAVLAEKQAEIHTQQVALNEKKSEIEKAQSEIDSKQADLNAKTTELVNGKASYEAGITKLENGLSSGKEQLAVLQSQQEALVESIRQLQAEKKVAEQAGDFTKVEEIETEIEALKAQLNQVRAAIASAEQSITETENKLAAIQVEYNSFMTNTYTPGIAMMEASQAELDEARTQVDAGKQQIVASQAKIVAAQEQVDAGNQQIAKVQAKINEAQAQVNAGNQQLKDAKVTLAQQESVLVSKEKQYEAGLKTYNQGISTYNENLKAYYSGLEKWTEGVEVLNQNSVTYESKVGQLTEAKAKLANKQNKLAEAKREFAQKQSESQQQIDEANEQIVSKENEYKEKLEEFESKKSKAEKEIAESEQDLKEAEEAVNDLSLPKYTVGDRKDNAGYKIYLNNSQSIDALSNVFPVFLFAIAALVSLTTMTRFVDEQRINIGTLKALGYSNRDIHMKFIVYGFVSSTLGSAIGAVIGHILLPVIIFNAYTTTTTFSHVELHFSPLYTIVAYVITILCTVLSAYLVAMKELREQPASLLLPKPPKTSSRILLERIKPIWKRMNFTYKVTARNLFRYKKRMFMTIFGVAGCIALLITGFGLKNSLSGIVDRQFGEIIKYDLIVVNNDDLDSGEMKELNNQLNDEAIQQTNSVHFEKLTVIAGDNNNSQSITLLVPEEEESFREFVHLQNRESGKNIELLNDGVVVSEKIADLLEVSIGDTIALTDSNDQIREMKIADITEMYMGHYLFMNKTEYKGIFGKRVSPNASLVTLKDSGANIEEIAADFISLSGVNGVQHNIQMSTQINAIMMGLNKVVLVLIIVSTMLAAVVIYNLTNINVSERIRELSTIKVLGFYDKEVTLYIYRETIILSIIGILVGYVVGFFLHAFIIAALPPDEFMFSPDLWFSNFALSTGITLLITFVIMIVMHYKMKYVNMLDALKSVE